MSLKEEMTNVTTRISITSALLKNATKPAKKKKLRDELVSLVSQREMVINLREGGNDAAAA